MNARYCANVSCGKKNEYTAVKPKFCGGCGKPFDQAFSSAVPSTPVPAPVSEPVPAPTRVYRDARGNDISHRFTQPTGRRRHGQVEEAEPEENDFYDENQMHDEAQQLAAGIRGSIRINIDEDEPRTVRLLDLPNIQQAMTNARGAVTKGKRRSRK